MASRRLIPALGAVAVAGGAYYLYNAGGDPRVAGKMVEREYLTAFMDCTAYA
jgi:hypothetical protein